MKNISFSLTTPQFKARRKWVTRRTRWTKAKAGDVLMGVEKGMGLKKGEKVVRLGKILITDVRRERLDAMTLEPIYDLAEAILEGFPDLSPAGFVRMFCKHNACTPETIITRIAFEYL